MIICRKKSANWGYYNLDKDTKKMLVRVLLYDSLILVITIIGSILFFKKYALVVIIGLLMGGINFILNAVVTSYILKNSGKEALYILGAIGRVIITLGVAVIISNNSIDNLVAFLIGYSLHYVAVLIYGLTRGTKKEGK